MPELSKKATTRLKQAAGLSYEDLLFADIRFFMKELWLAIGSDNEEGTGLAPLSEIELDMAEYLAHGPSRRIVLGTRGIGKTYIEAAVTCFKWNRDPNRKVLAISKSQEAVNKTSTLIRHWISTVSFLKHLKPRKDQRDSLTSFELSGSDTGRQPSFFILGIGGQVDNNRGHTVWLDDVETLKNSMTLQSRQELRRTVGNVAFCLFPDIPPERGGPIDGTETVYTLTPKHEETLAKDLMAEGFDVRAYPLCVPGPGEKNFPLAPAVKKAIAEGRYRKSDGCLLPHRFTEDDVRKLKAKRSLYLRECQMVMTLGESDRYPLKLKDFIVFDIGNETAPIHLSWGLKDHNGSTGLPITSIGLGDDRFYSAAQVDKHWAPFTQTRMRIDQAGMGKDGFPYIVGSHLNGFVHIRRLGEVMGGPTEKNYEHIAMVARDTNTTTITLETNFGGPAYANSLQVHCNRLKIAPGTDAKRPNGWACNVETKHAHVKKQIRIIDSIEPWLGAHRVVITPEIAMDQEWQRQITRSSRENSTLDKDDKADVTAGLLEDFEDMSRIDPGRAAGKPADDPETVERIKKLLKKYQPGSVNWIGRGKPSAIKSPRSRHP